MEVSDPRAWLLRLCSEFGWLPCRRHGRGFRRAACGPLLRVAGNALSLEPLPLKVCTANGVLHLSSGFALLGFPRSCTRQLWFVVFPLRPPGCTPAEALMRLSAAVAAAYGRVPRGQWAPLDADMLESIDRSACLVEPVLVVSRARAGHTEHVQRRVRSLLANVPIARPCGRSCAPRAAHPELLLSQRGDYPRSLTVLCTLSP